MIPDEDTTLFVQAVKWIGCIPDYYALAVATATDDNAEIRN